ncbi:hypothetical protein IE53DRAFT_398972 [Violaceomyces palustris]|uniref:Uncharacterized protein n=1 Tax=Violaceomyces palustris TaxID=1673888 RepID=A0ACD0NSM2_9BASI|nr:hypothetical protein IE53DRAFT_398972 [Violaceomyces palustris]
MDILRTPTALAEGDRRCNDHPFDDHRFLQHFIAVLSNLISCSGPGQSGNGFTAFAKLAGLPSQLLSHEEGESLSILAWASKHMVNQGEDRYESTSERSGSQASSELERLLKERRSRENREDASSSQIEDKEDLTLLAATLMVISFKITRGDIWGFSFFMEELRFLTGSLFKIDSHDTEPGSMKHHFFENVAYHDVFSSTSLLSEPVVPTGILSAYSLKSPQIVRTLTGLSLPLLLTIHQIGQLIRERRSRIKIARCDDDERTWKGTAARFSDEDLLTVIREAQKLEQDLVQEKERMALLVADQPHLAPHRYLHEVLRTTALLHLHSFIYGQSPQCLKIRLFVRQLLSLLEAMADENLPGYCSLHWALFITGLNATGEGHESSALDDRARIQQLYETFSDDFAFMNLGRSHRIIKEVWSRNQQGRIFVDWLDIVEEFDWELFLV